MIFHFDQYTLDTDRLELRCGTDPIDLEPQVFSVLSYLAENRDHVVSKDDLIEAVWDGRVISDSTLNSRINSARRAVGDDGKSQSVIRTFPRRGFRFVADVVEDEKERTAQKGFGGELREMARSRRPSIVVLPFQNMSSDPEHEHFSDGITEDISTALSKHQWLAVTARNTSFAYKGKHVDVRRLAGELGVDYAVEGSVRRSGNRVRVTAQLIDTSSGNHLWAERYDRELEDFFDVQDEITEAVAANVAPEVGAAEWDRVTRAPRRNLEAWGYYHSGIRHLSKFAADDVLEAQRLLQLSRELDPDFGEAHAWWAYPIYQGMVYWNAEASPQLLDEALAAADRALELDDQNAVFHVLKARVQLARREYAGALTESEMAITLNPGLAAAYCGYGQALTFEGDYDEAVDQFEKTIALDPQDPYLWVSLCNGALALIFKQDFEAALSWSERASEYPNRLFWPTAHKTVSLAYLERRDATHQSVEKLLAEKPGFTAESAERELFQPKRPDQMKLYLDGLRMAGVPHH